MRRSRRGAIAVAVLALPSIAACTLTPNDRSAPVPLPASAPGRVCAGVGVGALHIAPTPDNPSSPVSASWGSRLLAISWPPGFSATFDPELQVWAADGSPFARTGDLITASGWNGTFVCTGNDTVTITAR
jgi:hypothetical protein